MKSKTCRECGQTKALRDYYRNSDCRDGYQNSCKECHKAKERKRRAEYPRDHVQYHKDHKAQMRRNADRWRQANREKGRVYASRYRAIKLQAVGDHTGKEILAMLKDQDHRCAYCECWLEEDYDVDHMLPLSRGGRNDWTNLAITCISCNRSKQNKTTLEFLCA